MPTSGAWPIYVAVAAALTNDSAVMALLGADGVYSLQAPRDVSFDYIVLGTITETEIAAFKTGGSSLSLQVHLWCSGVDARRCARLYGEVYRVLHLSSLALGEPFSARSSAFLSLVGIDPDPQDPYVHGVARLELSALRYA